MRCKLSINGVSFACAVLCAAFVQTSAFGEYRFEDPRNYFGVWSGPVDERVAYAKTMGYSHILYAKDMENVKGASGLRFIIETPEYIAYPRSMDEDKEYTPEEKAEIKSMCAMKDASAPFPHNMASGWFADQHEAAIRGTTNGLAFRKYSLQANFQKKEVTDKIVSRICEYVKSIQERNPKFKFGGFCWDVPDPTGDFYGMRDDWPRPKQVTLAHWTGKDSVSTRPGEKLDYTTYSEGFLRYRIALRRAVAGINPKAAFIVDPWNIGRDWVMRFVNGGFDGEEFRDARADLVMSEGPDHFFEPECFTNGFLRADQIAYSCDLLSYDYGKEIANIGLVASRGAWSVWFGNPCPTMRNIRDVPPRMKLAHELPRLENLNNTPLEARRWDAQNAVYDSPTAHIDKDVVWAIHPYTKRLFFCFTSPTAVLKLPDGFKVEKVNALTSLFQLYRRAKLQKVFSISDGGELRISPGHEYVVGEAFIAIPVGSSDDTKSSARGAKAPKKQLAD